MISSGDGDGGLPLNEGGSSVGGGSSDEEISQNGSNDKKSSKLCLGVVGAKGAEIVLFDASGNPRTFSHKGDARKLCFSTHGIDADVFTHCFDEDGIHGTPDEGCYCGLDTPHLHAHVHDPKRCDSASSSADTDDFASLGVVTLHPIEPLTDENGEYKQLVRIPVSEELPNQCNSSEMTRQLRARGIDPADQALRRRIQQVQHDDHVDYLVHDTSTGHLHLEHPNCNNCGQNDVHGLFKCVGKRHWEDATGNRDVQIHFFETAPRPFSVIDFIHDLFEPTSQRVMAARPDPTHTETQSAYCTFLPDDLMKPPRRAKWHYSVPKPPPVPESPKEFVRSTLLCTQICCSSEVPMIRSVLEPLDGVDGIMVNVPLKQVLVDHDPAVITASGIETILNKNRFGASIKKDGGASIQASSKGRSQLLVQHICCASEIPAINKIVQPLPGVSNVSISVATKMVYVDHETSIITVQQICDALNSHHFGATIKHDAQKGMTSLASIFCSSTLSTVGGVRMNPAAVENALAKFDSSKIESFEVNAEANKIVVIHNPLDLSISAIIAVLEAETPVTYEAVVDGANFNQSDEVKENEAPALPNIYVVFSGIFLVVSLFSYIGDDWDYLKFVAVLSIACGIPPIALKAFYTLQRYQFDTNCLMLFAILGAIALEDFVEGGAVTFLFGISEWMELRATSRARSALSTIVSLRPEHANLIHPRTNEIVVVPASSVPIGALVSVKPGDKVPCDGLVVEGTSTVDESSLTGESRPICKAPNDEISGGTINSGFTQLTVRTTSTADNSAVARLIRLVEEAQANRSQTEKIVEEFAHFYTPLIVIGALIMCSVPWIHGRAAGKRWCHNGLVLMVVACPCALIISTPVAYVAGLAASAQKGILIKGGAHLEALGLVKRIAFDKTGTLTQGQFALLHLQVVGSRRSRKEVLEILSLMEERASHPLSQAILTAARNEGVSIPKDTVVLNHTFLAGEGVKGTINGLEVYVGNDRLFCRLGFFDSLPESSKETCQLWASTGGTVGFMSIEGEGILCMYSVADAVRPEAKEVVESLQRMGVSLSMLTGDNDDTALAIGEQIGLSAAEIQSRLLPEQKQSIVTSMKEDQRARSVISNPLSRPCLVLMCGDGVNDAPALAAADVSVAMGAGAALAMETSDVTLLDSDLRKLVFSIQMGRRVIRKIKENIIFSVAVKVVVVGFALVGRTRLWAAISSDVGAMILVTLNGMSLLPGQKDTRGNSAAAKTNEGSDAVDVEAFGMEDHLGAQPQIRKEALKGFAAVSAVTQEACKRGDENCCGGQTGTGDCDNRLPSCIGRDCHTELDHHGHEHNCHGHVSIEHHHSHSHNHDNNEHHDCNEHVVPYEHGGYEDENQSHNNEHRCHERISDEHHKHDHDGSYHEGHKHGEEHLHDHDGCEHHIRKLGDKHSIRCHDHNGSEHHNYRDENLATEHLVTAQGACEHHNHGHDSVAHDQVSHHRVVHPERHPDHVGHNHSHGHV